MISGVDTNHRQLIVYGRDGVVVWDADMGGGVLAAEVFDGRVFAGASNGFVQCFGAGGSRLWRRLLVEPVAGLAPNENGGCLAVLSDGTVVRLDGSGESRPSTPQNGRHCGAVGISMAGAGPTDGRTDGSLEFYR